MNSKPLSKEADIQKQLILKNVTTIRPIPNEYILKAMDEFAKQEATGFFKWYGVKMMEFIMYFKEKAKNPLIYSIPDGYDKYIEEFEGKTVGQLYEKYLESKEKKQG